MLTSEEIMEKIEGNIENIKKYGVRRIGLFGSYVKNEQKSESDIDILVRFERGKKTAKRLLIITWISNSSWKTCSNIKLTLWSLKL